MATIIEKVDFLLISQNNVKIKFTIFGVNIYLKMRLKRERNEMRSLEKMKSFNS